jgi:hypothetical protein
LLRIEGVEGKMLDIRRDIKIGALFGANHKYQQYSPLPLRLGTTHGHQIIGKNNKHQPDPFGLAIFSEQF